jgi:hypothetical protein
MSIIFSSLAENISKAVGHNKILVEKNKNKMK